MLQLRHVDGCVVGGLQRGLLVLWGAGETLAVEIESGAWLQPAAWLLLNAASCCWLLLPLILRCSSRYRVNNITTVQV